MKTKDQQLLEEAYNNINKPINDSSSKNLFEGVFNIFSKNKEKEAFEKDHLEFMKLVSLEIAKIGQKIKMGTCKEHDGNHLINLAKDIELELMEPEKKRSLWQQLNSD